MLFFTDILYMFGFNDVLTLDFHLQAWQNLINIVKPSIIIADYTPALVLAAKGIVPTIVVGNGFTVPPPVEKFPPLRDSPIPDDAIKRFQRVVENVKQVTGFHDSLGCLLNGDRSFIFAIPELDPYADVRGGKADYVGIHSAPFPPNLWGKNGEAWAYLMDDWCYRYLVLDTFKANYNFGDLKCILKGKSFALHHASFGTSITCLLAGIPQIIFPKDLETSITAKKLIDLGVAIAILPPFIKQTLLDATTYLPQITQNAQQQAKQLAYWNQNFLDKFVQNCLGLIN
ncbi:nucleotide disphospho-sugar-binding domain-containing protein [Calothrix rhizosoleniae]|uniref:nucleotide disphospho-sugar-binding domain-containing protein n=1 Tax=Calothrix rhizosoleniae TaxID=888997 RepID=UPI001178B071|nr:nucleotide disphospho-sugar-binding domain-containing protein [Calothrix rhizosoleniae]